VAEKVAEEELTFRDDLARLRTVLTTGMPAEFVTQMPELFASYDAAFYMGAEAMLFKITKLCLECDDEREFDRKIGQLQRHISATLEAKKDYGRH
jgi:hypothetical protein